MSLPDVTADHVTDAAKRAGCHYTENLFYRYAIGVGYRGRNAEDKARELDTTWKRNGYDALPAGVKGFILDICATQPELGNVEIPEGSHEVYRPPD